MYACEAVCQRDVCLPVWFFFMSPRLLGQMHAAFKWQDVLERFFFLGPNDKITPDVYFLL